MNKHRIKFHEKKLGQLFCDDSAQQIIDMLKFECLQANVTLIKNEISINSIYKSEFFIIKTKNMNYESESLVIATGGLSVPKIGASKFGYEIAKQFDLNIINTIPALVPLTFNENILEKCKEFIRIIS